MNIKLFLKCRPTSQIRGSNVRVKVNGLAGQGDSTRIKPASHGSIGRWWVGSRRVASGQEVSKARGSGRVGRFSNITGRVMSGQEAFRISRVGWVKSTYLKQSWVGSGQLIRPVRFDLTREKSWYYVLFPENLLKVHLLLKATAIRTHHKKHETLSYSYGKRIDPGQPEKTIMEEEGDLCFI